MVLSTQLWWEYFDTIIQPLLLGSSPILWSFYCVMKEVEPVNLYFSPYQGNCRSCDHVIGNIIWMDRSKGYQENAPDRVVIQSDGSMDCTLTESSWGRSFIMRGRVNTGQGGLWSPHLSPPGRGCPPPKDVRLGCSHMGRYTLFFKRPAPYYWVTIFLLLSTVRLFASTLQNPRYSCQS